MAVFRPTIESLWDQQNLGLIQQFDHHLKIDDFVSIGDVFLENCATGRS